MSVRVPMSTKLLYFLFFLFSIRSLTLTVGFSIPSYEWRSISKRTLYTGTGTYYEVPGTGSCGMPDTDDESVVAVNRLQMNNGADPNSNPECEKHVFIQGDQGTTTARVVDTCADCLEGDLDLSPKVFERVCGKESKGRCEIKWSFKQD